MIQHMKVLEMLKDQKKMQQKNKKKGKIIFRNKSMKKMKGKR